MPREQRLGRLRAALGALNRLLPRVGGVGVPAWRPFVPTTRLDAADHAIVRFVTDESFVLSTKERVPFLVFVEVVDADPATLPPPLPASPPRGAGRDAAAHSPSSRGARSATLGGGAPGLTPSTVSYTHLTLPTICSV